MIQFNWFKLYARLSWLIKLGLIVYGARNWWQDWLYRFMIKKISCNFSVSGVDITRSQQCIEKSTANP